jgi:UDP-N-acetylmuramate dehydrogenase
MKKYYQKNFKLKIYSSYKLSKLTTFKLGGSAEFFCKPRSLTELKRAFRFAIENNLKCHIIGGGSNLLISNKGVKGLVISTAKLNKISINNEKVIALCGSSVKKINKRLIKYSLSGMEFSGGLPGSIGGAVYMNARAYGGEFSDIVESVKALDIQGNEYLFNNQELNFSYKKSLFMDRRDLFIYSIILKLKKGNKKDIKLRYKRNIDDRKQKGQFDYPSAGCVFKNDYSTNTPAGRLIDELGLKGFQIGGARVYDKHANFIINKDKANPDDVVNLINFIEKKAAQEKKIKLEREIVLLGFDDHSI